MHFFSYHSMTIFFLLAFLSSSLSLRLRPLGQIPVFSTAFLKLGRVNSSSPVSLLSTSFSVLSGDGVYWVPFINTKNVNASQVQLLTSSITWPNEPSFVPPGTIKGYDSLFAVGAGFLVPTKTTGGVYLINSRDFSIYKISTDLSNWFYHRVRFYDVDGDGLQDIISSRAYKPLFGSSKGELVWFKQPASNPLGQPWVVNHIAFGPDFLWELVDLNNDGKKEIVAAEFFGQQLTLTYSVTGEFDNPNSIQQIVIDSHIKSGFDVHVLDINGDGKDDLVASNHEGDGTGAVYAYEVPGNWEQDWPRHTLASGFPVTEPGLHQASPGAPIPFYPQTSQKSGRGWIILAGDGSQEAYELRPNSPSGWDYIISPIVDAKATIGQPAVGDVDGDGYVEVFIPAYDTSTVYVYTYAP